MVARVIERDPCSLLDELHLFVMLVRLVKQARLWALGLLVSVRA